MKMKRFSFMTLISISAYQFMSQFQAMHLSTCWTDSEASPAWQGHVKVTLSRQGCWAGRSCRLPTRFGQMALQDI